MTVSLQEVDLVWREADCLFNREEVRAAIDVMAEKITAQLKDTNPLVLSLMSGAMVIAGKLLPRLDFHLQLDYIHATRYRNQLSGGNEVYSAVLVEKHHDRRQPPGLKADFVGLDVPDRYVFGYGMDYKGYLRNAPGIYAVKGQ